MFTGLVEEIGRVVAVEPVEDGRRIRIAAVHVLEGTNVGDSISLDGACHTVARLDGESFEVHSVATTLARTTLGGWEPGRRINLERALALGGRLGGHMVQGHVDAVGEVLAIQPGNGHTLIDFTLPPLVAEVTILHGSITVNGVSLTVNALPGPGVGQVSIIPHTWEVTALPDVARGEQVNLEGDLIGKYVRRLLGEPGRPEAGGAEHVRHHWGY